MHVRLINAASTTSALTVAERVEVSADGRMRTWSGITEVDQNGRTQRVPTVILENVDQPGIAPYTEHFVDPITDIKFAPDSRILAITSGCHNGDNDLFSGTITIWDIEGGSVVARQVVPQWHPDPDQAQPRRPDSIEWFDSTSFRVRLSPHKGKDDEPEGTLVYGGHYDVGIRPLDDEVEPADEVRVLRWFEWRVSRSQFVPEEIPYVLERPQLSVLPPVHMLAAVTRSDGAQVLVAGSRHGTVLCWTTNGHVNWNVQFASRPLRFLATTAQRTDTIHVVTSGGLVEIGVGDGKIANTLECENPIAITENIVVDRTSERSVDGAPHSELRTRAYDPSTFQVTKTTIVDLEGRHYFTSVGDESAGLTTDSALSSAMYWHGELGEPSRLVIVDTALEERTVIACRRGTDPDAEPRAYVRINAPERLITSVAHGPIPYCINRDLTDGHVNWSVPLQMEIVALAAMPGSNIVVGGTVDGRVAIIDADSGKISYHDLVPIDAAVPSPITAICPVRANWLFVATTSGLLYEITLD